MNPYIDYKCNKLFKDKYEVPKIRIINFNHIYNNFAYNQVYK